MKKFFIATLLIFVGLATIFYFARKPLLSYVGSKARNWAEEKLNEQGVSLDWDALNFDLEHLGFLDYRLNLKSDLFCFSKKESLRQACFKDLRVRARVDLKKGLQAVRHIGPIRSSNAKIELAPGDASEKKPPELSIPSITLPDFLQDTGWSPINFPEWRIEIPDSEKESTFIEGSLHMSPREEHWGTLQTQGTFKTPSQALSFSAQLDSKSGLVKDDLEIESQISELNTGLFDVSATGHKTQGGEAIEGAATWKIKQSKLAASGKISFTISSNQIDLSMNGNLSNSGWPQATLSQCKAHFQIDRFDLNCPITLAGLQNYGKPKVRSEIPPKLRLKATADIKHSGLIPKPEDIWEGTVQVETEPYRNDWIEALLSVRSSVKGSLNDASNAKLESKIRSRLDIQHFQKLVKILKRTPYAIPAPLDVLDGPMNLNIKGTLSSMESGQLPFTFNTRLRSKEQRFDVNSEGQVNLWMPNFTPKKIHIQNNTTLKDIRLRLPDLSTRSLPKLGMDDRIVREKPKPKAIKKDEKESPMQVSYEARIKTARKNSIQLLNETTKKALPISLDLKLKDGTPPNGQIELHATPVKLFRRDAFLDHFNITLKTPAGHSELDGRLSVSYVDYKIFIKVVGTVDRARVLFQSEPPLPEEDIISVLIYGEPMSSLDTTDSDSVGALSAALSDRALALASLYLFASTPIQRVGYDPSSKKVTARVRLGEGTSLVLGGNNEEQETGIRKHLGKGWYITTMLHTGSSDNQNSKASTFLEWLKRF